MPGYFHVKTGEGYTLISRKREKVSIQAEYNTLLSTTRGPTAKGSKSCRKQNPIHSQFLSRTLNSFFVPSKARNVTKIFGDITDNATEFSFTFNSEFLRRLRPSEEIVYRKEPFGVPDGNDSIKVVDIAANKTLSMIKKRRAFCQIFYKRSVDAICSIAKQLIEYL